MVQGCGLQDLIDVMHTRDTADRQTSSGDEGLARREREAGEAESSSSCAAPKANPWRPGGALHLPSRAGRLSQGR
jgi:hypothetical protein